MANFSVPILPISTVSGNQWTQQRIIEEATQTFYAGTPVVITSDGGVEVWGGSTLTNGILGISYEAASNLATTGKGAPTPLAPFSGVGAAAGTFGSVPNQSSAVNIAHGAPLNDGRIGVTIAAQDVVFAASFGTSAAGTGSSVAAATPAATNVGIAYGLTLDTNGYWFVDVHKTTTSAAVTVIGLDLRVAPFAGSLVHFVFLSTAAQMPAAT